jgi:hypothetical protein
MSTIRSACSKTTDVHCTNSNCNALLGKIDDTGFTIRRGEMEIHYSGSGVISIRCYQRRCHSLNVLRLNPESTPRGTAA